MTRPVSELDNSGGTSLGARFGRLLDRMDARIASVGRAIWRDVVEGFALCGRAHCVVPIDWPDTLHGESDYERETVPIVSHSYWICNSDLRDDFADLDALMSHVCAMEPPRERGCKRDGDQQLAGDPARAPSS
jgi:hypothetical protein